MTKFVQRRIVSLVPSLSESLAYFGLKDQIVGVTQFCVNPPDLHRTAAVIGGTKDPDLAAIARLSPTHIIANAEENTADFLRLCKSVAPTLVTLPKGPRDVIAMVEAMEQFLALSESERGFSGKLRSRLRELFIEIDAKSRSHVVAGRRKKRFIYLIWREPYMVAAKDTYISRCLEEFFFENCIEDGDRYPTLDLKAAALAKPDIIFFSTEPYPFRVRDREKFKAAWPNEDALPDLIKIDGQAMSWYGPQTVSVLEGLLNWTGTVGELDQHPRLAWNTALPPESR